MCDDEQASKRLEKFGIKATKLYCIVLFGGIPILAHFGAIKIDQISINEFGDTLAGLFGPLAIFWLVLGFFQQGQELRNSVATLELQAKELANSVEQQRELVQVSRQQLDHERNLIDHQENARKKSIQPNFVVDFAKYIGRGDNHGKYNISITNIGGAATNLSVLLHDASEVAFAYSIPYAEKGWNLSRVEAFNGRMIPDIDRELTVQINFKDDDGQSYEVEISLNPPPSADGFGKFSSKLVNTVAL